MSFRKTLLGLIGASALFLGAGNLQAQNASPRSEQERAIVEARLKEKGYDKYSNKEYQPGEVKFQRPAYDPSIIFYTIPIWLLMRKYQSMEKKGRRNVK
jgi:hypothetical protein